MVKSNYEVLVQPNSEVSREVKKKTRLFENQATLIRKREFPKRERQTLPKIHTHIHSNQITQKSFLRRKKNTYSHRTKYRTGSAQAKKSLKEEFVFIGHSFEQIRISIIFFIHYFVQLPTERKYFIFMVSKLKIRGQKVEQKIIKSFQSSVEIGTSLKVCLSCNLVSNLVHF